MVDWRRAIRVIHETVAKAWKPWGDEDKRFLAVGMSGEVGEALNLIKKEWRGDFRTNGQQQEYLSKFRGEMADIRIYLELLAMAYHIDLDLECQRKIPELLKRWPEAANRMIEEKLT